MPLENLINLNDEAKRQMEIIDTLDFNIFEVRDSTKKNELITVASFLFHKHRFYSKLNIPVETFMSFIAKI